jgi:hypothetical protein
MFPVKYLSVFNSITLCIRKKQKPTVTPNVIPCDKLQFLKKKLDDPHVSQFLRRDFIREIVGGTCSICPETPTKIEISPGGYCSN